jgi:hypothetical protein
VKMGPLKTCFEETTRASLDFFEDFCEDGMLLVY